MTAPTSFAVPKLTTARNADGSRSVTLSYTNPVSGAVISLQTTMSVDAAGEAHLAFLAHGIAIDSAWSDV